MGWQKTGKGHNSHTGHAAVTSLTISVKSWMTLHEPNKAADTAVVAMAKIATTATTIKEIKKVSVLYQRQWSLPQLWRCLTMPKTDKKRKVK